MFLRRALAVLLSIDDLPTRGISSQYDAILKWKARDISLAR
jgi:hypothetical protein